MKTLLKFSHAMDKVSEWLGRVSILLVMVAVVVGFYNVVARYIGRSLGLQLSSNKLIEIQWYLYSMIFFLAFAYILKHGDNVRVDFLYTNWSPKKRAWVDFLGTLLFLIPFCIMGIYVTISPVMNSWGLLPSGEWGSWELSPDPGGLPRAPIKSMIIVAFITLLLQAIGQLIKYLAIITGPTQVVDEIVEEIVDEESAHELIG